jgi:hypothetical protein
LAQGYPRFVADRVILMDNHCRDDLFLCGLNWLLAFGY